METKKKPIRRFRGYNEVWEQRKLGDIADKVTTKNTGTQYIETLTNSAEQGIISQRDYFDHDVSNMDNIDGYYIVENNDFVYNPRISTSAPVGPVNRNKLGKTGVMSPLYTVFKTHSVDESYLEWFFKSSHWHKFMYFNGDTGARSDRFAIKDAVFFDMPIPMPSIEEQCRVGTFLAELDNLIALHQRKHEKLQSLKKAYLSEMFPLPGEKRPRRRFAGFTGDWEQRKLGDIAEVKDSARIPNNEWTESGVPYIRASDISNDDLSGVLFISKDKYEFYKERTGAPNKNDVLFNGGGEIGKAVLKEDDSPVYVQGGAVLYVRTSESEHLRGDYLVSYFSTKSAEQYIEVASAGGTMKHYTLKPAQNMPVVFPGAEEQEKIGAYFTELDNLIALHQRKLAKLQALKKAYLTEMFP